MLKRSNRLWLVSPLSWGASMSPVAFLERWSGIETFGAPGSRLDQVACQRVSYEVSGPIESSSWPETAAVWDRSMEVGVNEPEQNASPALLIMRRTCRSDTDDSAMICHHLCQKGDR